MTTRLRIARGALLATAVLWPAAVSAQEAAPSCDTYELRGASQTADDPEVTFVEAWRPTLHEVATCLARPEAAQSCIEVQGQFDEQSFPPAVERALGGRRAAQLDRAKGRSDAVATELDAVGVPYERIRRRPPQAVASYRGVRLRVLPGCVATAHAAALPEWLASPEAVAQALERTRARPVAIAPPPARDPAPPLGPFSVDGAARFGALITSADDAFAFSVNAGLGYQRKRFYARVNLGAGTADRLEQRAFFEWGASAGGLVRPWLRVGGALAHRVGTYRLRDPWYEQAWAFGVESEQRLASLGAVSVWLGESISPAGFRVQRGTVKNGEPVDSPDELHYAARFDAQLIVRGNFGR